MASPIEPGWYPDLDTGGSKYWDGARWTGHAKPPEKQKFTGRTLGFILAGVGALFVFSFLSALFGDSASEDVSGGALIVMLVLGLGGLVSGIYLIRGRGKLATAVEHHFVTRHRDKELEKRNAELAVQREQWKVERKNQQKQQNRDDLRKAILSRVERPKRSHGDSGAQVDALLNPETAKALQNLQNLLYTQTITEAEFQAAKNKLFGNL